MRRTKSNKWCWLARESKDGWSVSLAVGDETFRLKGLTLHDVASVITLLNSKDSVVFIHLADSKTVPKLKKKKKARRRSPSHD